MAALILLDLLYVHEILVLIRLSQQCSTVFYINSRESFNAVRVTPSLSKLLEQRVESAVVFAVMSCMNCLSVSFLFSQGCCHILACRASLCVRPFCNNMTTFKSQLSHIWLIFRLLNCCHVSCSLSVLICSFSHLILCSLPIYFRTLLNQASYHIPTKTAHCCSTL